VSPASYPLDNTMKIEKDTSEETLTDQTAHERHESPDETAA